jgi:hypothetical protein
MNQQTGIDWDSAEKNVAEAALEKAYSREVEALICGVRDRAKSISLLDEVWQLHDFLSARRHEIDGKYDREESSLVFTLSRLVKDGWLELSELEGLDAGKRAKVGILTRM